MNKRREILVDVLKHLPAGAISRAWGWLARLQHPVPFVTLLKRVFVARTGIDMGDALAAEKDYPSLEALFVRQLKAGVRPVDTGVDAVCSPVDGTVGACGRIEDGTALQVKGKRYSIARLLGDAAAAARFEGGHYVTLYLSPKDYHRIHAPLAGTVAEATLIPGRLLPVFAEAVAHVDELFAVNERIVTYLDVQGSSRMAVVKVGATMVGRITLAYDSTVWSNRTDVHEQQKFSYDPPHVVAKGAELGAFCLGSTVVVLTEANTVAWQALQPGTAVRVGQRLGDLVAGVVADVAPNVSADGVAISGA